MTTQIPYAATVAGVSFITYIVAGATQNVFIPLAFGAVLTVVVLAMLRKLWGAKSA